MTESNQPIGDDDITTTPTAGSTGSPADADASDGGSHGPADAPGSDTAAHDGTDGEDSKRYGALVGGVSIGPVRPVRRTEPSVATTCVSGFRLTPKRRW